MVNRIYTRADAQLTRDPRKPGRAPDIAMEQTATPAPLLRMPLEKPLTEADRYPFRRRRSGDAAVTAGRQSVAAVAVF
jgi:hypothetical protein